jgi:thymidylate kinase
MLTVAVIGPDGAGKTTICRRLARMSSLPIKRVYMGVNLNSSNHMLPTTRFIYTIKKLCGVMPETGGPPDPDHINTRPRGIVKRVAVSLKSGMNLMLKFSEEWYRQGLASFFQRRGHIVLFDRHFFFDYYVHDIKRGDQQRPLSKRIHGYVLEHYYPKPDLVIFLNAPAEVLFARKREGTLRALENRRQEYLQIKPLVKNFVTVDASRSEDDVLREVSDLICHFYRLRGGKAARFQDARNQ